MRADRLRILDALDQISLIEQFSAVASKHFSMIWLCKAPSFTG